MASQAVDVGMSHGVSRVYGAAQTDVFGRRSGTLEKYPLAQAVPFAGILKPWYPPGGFGDLPNRASKPETAVPT